MPYQLKIENNTGYGQNCHFCNNSRCSRSCPLPYSSSMTLLDLLHKVGAEDNISFYNNHRGKHDVVLNVVY